jgi:hypothetical protein
LAFGGQAASAQAGFAVAPTAASLEGAWKVTKVVRTGPHAGTDIHPQPSLAIYSHGYYSILRDNGLAARKAAPAPKDPANPTNAEKIAKYEEWAPYSASGGSYEVKGDRLITHNVIAKQVRGTSLTEEAVILAFTGDTLVLHPIPPPGLPDDIAARTYTRVR